MHACDGLQPSVGVYRKTTLILIHGDALIFKKLINGHTQKGLRMLLLTFMNLPRIRRMGRAESHMAIGFPNGVGMKHDSMLKVIDGGSL